MVQHLRALPIEMGHEEHDRHVALLSHLPHVLANALLVRSADFDFRAIQGSSWRDLTRVGGSNPALWADILVANGPAVLSEIDATWAVVGELRAAIEQGDTGAVRAVIERAQEAK
jgi:prephenate dehydrogenase